MRSNAQRDIQYEIIRFQNKMKIFENMENVEWVQKIGAGFINVRETMSGVSAYIQDKSNFNIKGER